MTITPPIALMLDKQAHARLHENGLLPWWIQNTSGGSLAEVRVEPTVLGAVPDLRIKAVDDDALGLPDAGMRRLSMPFCADKPGHYALRVRLTVRRPDGVPLVWESPHEILLEVGNPDAQGQVNMTFEEPALVKGHLPPGHYVFKAPVVVKPEDGQDEAPAAAPLGLAADLPPPERQLLLPLVPVAPPGLGADLDLARFARHWLDTRRPQTALFSFVDRQGRPLTAPARVRDVYRLQCQSYRGGHITLIGQGTSGRYFQLAPHTHWGQQVAPASKAVAWPDQVLTNYGLFSEGGRPDPGWAAGEVDFQHPGCERALVLVSPAPMATPRAVYMADGEAPYIIDTAQVRRLLAIAWALPDVELGYTEVTVQG